MAMGLSFTEAFFTGNLPLDEIEPSDEPTSVLQAIISMPEADQRRLAIEVFGQTEETADDYIEAEDWPTIVLDKVRETDRCGSPTVPVDVYIDEDGYWTLDIYSNECQECGAEIDHDCNGPCPCCHDGGGPV